MCDVRHRSDKISHGILCMIEGRCQLCCLQHHIKSTLKQVVEVVVVVVVVGDDSLRVVL